jgi:hypothetical protein
VQDFGAWRRRGAPVPGLGPREPLQRALGVVSERQPVRRGQLEPLREEGVQEACGPVARRATTGHGETDGGQTRHASAPIDTHPHVRGVLHTPVSPPS